MTVTGNRAKRRAGQTMVFLIVVLVILVFVVLWNFDLHKILYVKGITQNAGDSAALAAASNPTTREMATPARWAISIARRAALRWDSARRA